MIDYHALLAREVEREPALASDASVPVPDDSRPALPRRVADRASRYVHRVGTLLRGQRGSRWWLPRRDFELVQRRPPEAPRVDDIGVHLHVFFMDLLPELLERLEHLPGRVAVYATTDSELKAAAICNLLQAHPRVREHREMIVANRGRDIGPWVTAMARLNARHETWCHLHTKKSLHAPEVGRDWREFLLDSLVGSPQKVHDVLASFAASPRLGLVVPAFHAGAVKEDFVPWDDRDRAAALYRRLGLSRQPPRRPFFAAGTMCWYRSDALAPLFRAGFEPGDFDAESGQVTGTLMHAIERALADVAAERGYTLAVSLPG